MRKLLPVSFLPLDFVCKARRNYELGEKMPRQKIDAQTEQKELNGQMSLFDNQTDDALIAENFRLEDEIAAGTAKLNEWAKPKKERIAAIEGEISRRLLERKADSTKTDSGTAYFSHLMNTKIEDQAKLFDFVADNWDAVGADTKINVKIDTVRQHMDENEGKPPPGISISYYTRLNIKRS